MPALLLTVQAGLLAYNAYMHSPTLNEPAHLAAGISHWQFGRFELYRVNPPLVRVVAALPVLAAGAKTDWSSFNDGPDARPVFTIGDDFVAANRGRTIWLMTLVPQITIDGPPDGVLTQFVPAVVLWPGRRNRHERLSHPRRRKVKVPSPPTCEGRGEGNVRGKFPFWLTHVVVRSQSFSTPCAHIAPR